MKTTEEILKEKSEQLTEWIIKLFPEFFDNFDGWEFGDGSDAGKKFKKIYNQAKKLNRMAKKIKK